MLPLSASTTKKNGCRQGSATAFPAARVKEEYIQHAFHRRQALLVSEQTTGRIQPRTDREETHQAANSPRPRDLIGGKWTNFRVSGEEVAELGIAEAWSGQRS